MSGKNLFKVAGLIAAITILSKIVGFARDVVTAQAYGATLVSDAYFYAYQIPALALILLGGLGGPFHTATIAVFSKLIPDIKQRPEKEVKTLLNSFITITGLGFLVLTILIMLFSEPIIQTIAGGGSPELHHLASVQLKIMAPILLIGGVIGILYGISNVYNEFLFTSLSPTIASIAVIAGIFMLKNDNSGIILAWSTLIGAVGQLLIQLPVYFKSGFSYKPEFKIFNTDMLKIREILLPAMIGTTIGQINIYIDMFFASSLPEGAWSAIGYANRIFQFPVGIIITAMLVPLFPMFSNFVGKKDWDSLKYYFHQGLTSLWFMAFPILAFIIILSQDTIQLLLQRGQFNAQDTLMVTDALIFISFSIIPYVARDTLTRMFYAFDDSKTPFYIAIFSIFVKATINYLFIGHLGVKTIMLSTTVVTLVNALLLAGLMKKKINFEYIKLLKPTCQILAVTLGMSLIVYILKLNLDTFMPDTTLFLSIKLSLYGLTGLISYFYLSNLLKIEIANKVIDKLKSKIFGKKGESSLVIEE